MGSQEALKKVTKMELVGTRKGGGGEGGSYGEWEVFDPMNFEYTCRCGTVRCSPETCSAK